VQLEWSQPVFSRLLGRLARHNTLVRFDGRNTGLSDRGLPLDADSTRLDIEAVVRRVGLETFALTGVQAQSVGVIKFAAAHPEQVSRLVFVDGFSRGGDMAATQASRALFAAIQVDFELGTELIGAAAFGTGRDESRDYGAYIRSCIDASYFANTGDGEPPDVTDVARTLTVPTLVLKHATVQYVTMEMVRDLAANIAGSRMSIVPGGWADDPEGLADRICEFINETPPSVTRKDEQPSEVSLRTVLFTDIVGHTEMMQRLGDAKGRDVLREHERITRETLKKHGGAEVKTMGDGFMASFGSVTRAMDCAIALQRAFAAHTESMPEPLHVRVGLNAGEPIEEDGDLFGATVILASRIAAKADAGEILVPDTVRGLLSGKTFVFSDRGEHEMKGFDDAVRLYEVRWRE
jgi:class 3 adenylate cyclase